jgi:hypothetical protein
VKIKSVRGRTVAAKPVTNTKTGLLSKRLRAPFFQALLLNEDSSPGLSRDENYQNNIISKELILENNGIPRLVLSKIAHTLKRAQSVSSP